VVAGAEVEEVDEVGVVPEPEAVPVLEAVLEALKVIPTAAQAEAPALRAACRSAPWHVFSMHCVVP